MKPTLDDLGVALHEQADLAAYPDVDALVAGAARRVALTRRRRHAALSAATAAVLLVGGLVATTGSTHRSALQPAEPRLGSFSVNAGGAGFPEYQQGMRRVTVLDAPMLARMKGSIRIPTTPGEQLVVKMTCTSPDVALTTEWLDQMIVNFTSPGGKGTGLCGIPGGGAGEVIGTATGATTTVTADVSLAPGSSPIVAAPKAAKIHAAIYESVPWQEYPFPPRPTGTNTPVWQKAPVAPDGTVTKGADTPVIIGPTSAAEANKAVTMSLPHNPKRELLLEVRGPGRLMVLINGNNISDLIGGPTPVRDGYLTYWNYDALGNTFPLDPQFAALGGAAGPLTKPGAQVALVIIPQDFTGPDWRLTYQSPTG